ncbi:hypothetical protein ONA91_16585 [Micromonospora sp. DR5-3]|uniref:hypothetical protein n=1 Tax=unclassified Micromonospora TaxID=2617518 RepID=UPI0011D8A18A|nr:MULTISPECIES: hypothetical protein [unclassified Micromonospora]MCW3816060.1 hypothetical protein [Micromonospora sp. DR5-3]TYC21264.1 hypothetical protein FXF52_26700 [Micromonospora sp. MP36]
MWKPPTPAEQELWNAVVAGVHAANRMDRGGFDAAVDRLTRLPGAWVRRTLTGTTRLLAEEFAPAPRDPWPLVAVQIDRVGAWLPEVDPQLLAALLPGRHRPLDPDVPDDPRYLMHRLLLIACLSNVAQSGVGAFVDVALARDGGRAGRRLSGLVPQHRTGR